jgi:anaphase-promoting complex subunit 3
MQLDNSVIQTSIRPSRVAGLMAPPPPPLNAHTQPAAPALQQPVPSRPLSSADESGPVTKRLRHTTRSSSRSGQNATAEAVKSSTLDADETSKKARARPALTLANIFSSSGRRSQPKAAPNAPAKPGREPAAAVTRRSTRLLSNTNSKPNGKVALSLCEICGCQY